jgi:hypothetical protein
MPSKENIGSRYAKAELNTEETTETRYARANPETETISSQKIEIIEPPLISSTENLQSSSEAERYLKSFRRAFPLSYALIGLFLAILAFEGRIVFLAGQNRAPADYFDVAASLFIVLPVLWFIGQMLGWNARPHAGDRIMEVFLDNGRPVAEGTAQVRRRLKRDQIALTLLDKLPTCDATVIKNLKDEAFTSSVMLGLSKRGWLDGILAVRGYYRISRVVVEQYDRSFSNWFFVLAMRNFMLSGFINEFSGIAESVLEDLTGAALGGAAGKVAGLSGGLLLETYMNYRLLLAFGIYLTFISRPVPFTHEENTKFIAETRARLADFKKVFGLKKHLEECLT